MNQAKMITNMFQIKKTMTMLVVLIILHLKHCGHYNETKLTTTSNGKRNVLIESHSFTNNINCCQEVNYFNINQKI